MTEIESKDMVDLTHTTVEQEQGEVASNEPDWNSEDQRQAYADEADRSPEVEDSKELIFGCRFDPVSDKAEAEARAAKLKELGRLAFATMRKSR